MEKYRQYLHIEPPCGWLNDPNGLSFFNEKYHVYFQHSPESPTGNSPRCWGHLYGNNLYKMKFDKDVLVPDIKEDRNGVYSGSAVVYNDKLHIFYTGNVKHKGDFDYITKGREANVIHVVSSDGTQMSEKKVVLRNSDYPDFCSCHVRDPKVWYENNLWHMVLGARTLDDKGCVLLYSSDDLDNWKYEKSLSIPDFGYMWECPDIFEIKGHRFLSVSPQGLPHGEYKYQNIYESGYFALKSDTLTDFIEWDMGFDFYAPQTFETPDGRRILFGWMGMGCDDYTNPTANYGWQHCLTLPREITLSESGKLKQTPMREISEFFGEYKNIKPNENTEIKLPFDMNILTDDNLIISFDKKLYMKYNAKSKIFEMTFTDEKYGSKRKTRKAALTSYKGIRIVADMSSVEIYLNGGETVLSSRFYPESEYIGVESNVGGIFSEMRDNI